MFERLKGGDARLMVGNVIRIVSARRTVALKGNGRVLQKLPCYKGVDVAILDNLLFLKGSNVSFVGRNTQSQRYVIVVALDTVGDAV